MVSSQQQVQIVTHDQTHPHPQQVQHLQQPQTQGQLPMSEQIYMEVAELEVPPDKNPEGQQQFAVSWEYMSAFVTYHL